jgi:regulator of RNase E activity RraA
MFASDTKGVIVGYAVTAQIAAIEPPTESVSVIRERRMGYYRAMSESVKPSIAVVEDLDYPNCIGAFWGEVNTTIHKGFGMSGALTNGVMRDLGDIGPSHGFVHVRSVNQPVNIFGMNIKPGDLVHADRHGAVVIPIDVIDDLEASILKMQETERLVLDPARKKGFDFNAFEAAWNDFEKART